MGEAPGIHGYFVAAGMNSVGVLSAGGLGRIVAHWVVSGRPDVDVTGIDVARFRSWQLDPRHRAERTAEVLGTVFAAHAPGTQLAFLARRVRAPRCTSGSWPPAAYLRDVSGWDAAAWYAGAGEAPTAAPSWGRQPWWRHWEAEHRAVREAVGVLDMSFMAKLAVRGPDAGAVLDRLSAGAVDERDRRITYTQWLGEDGGIDADVTVTRLAPDDFLVVASDTAHGRVVGMLRRGSGDARATVEDVTEDLALLSVQGPASRAVLAALAPGDRLVDAGVPLPRRAPGPARRADVLAVRVTYVGELGWELYVRAGAALRRCGTRSSTAGAAHGIRPVGLAALSSLRLEKGYRDLGHDLDNTDDVWGAGLGFAVALDKPGRLRRPRGDARREGGGPPRRRIVSVVVAGPRAAALPRRGGAAGRRARRRRPVRVLRVDASGRRSGSPAWRTESGVTREWLGVGHVGGRRRAAPATRPASRCARPTTRRAPA